MLTFDLVAETEALRQEHGWRDSGHSAKTLVKHQDQRIVLIAMKAGTRMMKHEAPGAISIQVLSGRLRVHAGRATFELPSASLLALDRALPHDVEATEDSSLVLTLCSKVPKRSVSTFVS